MGSPHYVGNTAELHLSVSLSLASTSPCVAAVDSLVAPVELFSLGSDKFTTSSNCEHTPQTLIIVNASPQDERTKTWQNTASTDTFRIEQTSAAASANPSKE